LVVQIFWMLHCWQMMSGSDCYDPVWPLSHLLFTNTLRAITVKGYGMNRISGNQCTLLHFNFCCYVCCYFL